MRDIIPLLESGSRANIDAWVNEKIENIDDAKKVIAEMLIVLMHLYHKGQ